MKPWFDALLGLALVGVWAVVASTASQATVREDARAAPAASAQVAVGSPPALTAPTAPPTTR